MDEEAQSFSGNSEEPDMGESTQSEEATETFEDSSSLSESNRGDVTPHASSDAVSPSRSAQDVAASSNHSSDSIGGLSIPRQQLKRRRAVESDDDEVGPGLGNDGGMSPFTELSDVSGEDDEEKLERYLRHRRRKNEEQTYSCEEFDRMAGM